MKNSKTKITIAGFALALLLVSFAYAGENDYWACFNEGDNYRFCNTNTNIVRCNSALGYCNSPSYVEICVGHYNESGDCYSQGSPMSCNSNGGQKCSNLNSNDSIDSEPPTFNLNSPVNNRYYDSRSVLFDVASNEVISIYYMNNLDQRSGFKRICSACDRVYARELSMKEGLNNLTIRVEDRNNQYTDKIVIFYIDSQKPKILKTEPKGGRNVFADGMFSVEFKEQNPKTLKLYYGNLTKQKTVNVNLSSCYDSGSKKKCDIDARSGISEYNGQQIEYWFELTDIANAVAVSKRNPLNVDTVLPVVRNPTSFWTQGSGSSNKYIYFNMSINELNFDEVVYTYYDTRGNLKEKRICSKLVNGVCEKRVTFAKGNHQITVVVRDDAGNAVGLPAQFTVI